MAPTPTVPAATARPVNAPLPPKTPARKMRFQLLQGRHIDSDPVRKLPNGLPADKLYTSQQAGGKPGEDIIEDDRDLEELLGSNKIRRLHEGSPVDNPFLFQPAPGETADEFQRRQTRLKAAQTPQLLPPGTHEDGTDPSHVVNAGQPKQPPNLDAMSVRDLQAYAAEEEIDLRGIPATKEALLRHIKGPRK